ncbi:MAG TPA: hypothetical protein VFJ29_00105 [Candidatus Kapabacteria bacterium]|nr:hypothetical protein [Candidatus Kapabacteria bacterium]
MKQFIVLFAMIAFVATGYGAGKKKSESKVKNPNVALTGYLVDVHCAKKMMEKNDVAMQARQHERSCDLMDDCAASGYGIFVVVPKSTTHASDVDYYQLDAAGNKQAKAILESSTQKDNVLVTVNGRGMIKVESMVPVKE